MTTDNAPLPDLDALLALADAATPGPYVYWMNEADSEFMRAAKAAVPALVDEVQALREKVRGSEWLTDGAIEAQQATAREANEAIAERDALRDRLRDAEAQRDALLVEYDTAIPMQEPYGYAHGVYLRRVSDLTRHKVESSHPDSEAAHRAAAAWQQLIDAARAGAAANKTTGDET